ncbi:MAG TPA: WYL domain-containing transcriptional regulator [Caldisericia bacterium]|nr:WYL domain-containing transcriptional regulator [Caldisericia bacterium]HPC57220.1 WYL domain-containing transcriptional regulator [Caldisericia bacterium]HRT37738.1 WYL domain-containing transcriptional regulator [Caldisericia bacterium]
MKKFTLGRLFRIYEKIREGTFPNVEYLSKEEEVSERTIKRDIQTLKYTLDAPISYSKSRNGYYLTKNWEFPFPELSTGEILTLFIANNLLKDLKGTPLYETGLTLSKKLEKLLPERVSIKDREIEEMLSISFQPIKIKKDIVDIFDKLFNSIRERNSVLIKYYTISRDEETERIVDPYHLYNFEGVWYLVAYCHKRGEVRDFALDRINGITVLKEKFNFKEDFNIKEYLQKSFRIYKGNEDEFTLLFDPYQAKWIKERIWHNSQKISENPDGSLILKIKGNKEEIKRWIIGYGKHVLVLEPESFREEIINELDELSEKYKNKGTPPVTI